MVVDRPLANVIPNIGSGIVVTLVTRLPVCNDLRYAYGIDQMLHEVTSSLDLLRCNLILIRLGVSLRLSLIQLLQRFLIEPSLSSRVGKVAGKLDCHAVGIKVV